MALNILNTSLCIFPAAGRSSSKYSIDSKQQDCTRELAWCAAWIAYFLMNIIQSHTVLVEELPSAVTQRPQSNAA